MGYRSEVAIRCQDIAFSMFKNAWGELTPDKIVCKKNDNLIYWDLVKWYEDYPDVFAVERVMSELDKYDDEEAIDKGFGYRFMRLGEDDSDIETRENNYEIQLWMIRKIDLSDFEDE